jgi:hypothetical protein
VTVNSALTNDSPPLVGTKRVDDTKTVNRDVIFDLDSMAEEVATVSTHLSTEIFDNDEALCRMDADSLVRNIDLVSDIIVSDTVKAELSIIFDSPRYKSPEATAIVVHAAKFPLCDVMLTIYTKYHSPLCRVLFSHLDHSNELHLC